jgi:hypothetical protein
MVAIQRAFLEEGFGNTYNYPKIFQHQENVLIRSNIQLL